MYSVIELIIRKLETTLALNLELRNLDKEKVNQNSETWTRCQRERVTQKSETFDKEEVNQNSKLIILDKGVNVRAHFFFAQVSKFRVQRVTYVRVLLSSSEFNEFRFTSSLSKFLSFKLLSLVDTLFKFSSSEFWFASLLSNFWSSEFNISLTWESLLSKFQVQQGHILTKVYGR